MQILPQLSIDQTYDLKQIGTVVENIYSTAQCPDSTPGS